MTTEQTTEAPINNFLIPVGVFKQIFIDGSHYYRQIDVEKYFYFDSNKEVFICKFAPSRRYTTEFFSKANSKLSETIWTIPISFRINQFLYDVLVKK